MSQKRAFCMIFYDQTGLYLHFAGMTFAYQSLCQTTYFILDIGNMCHALPLVTYITTWWWYHDLFTYIGDIADHWYWWYHMYAPGMSAMCVYIWYCRVILVHMTCVYIFVTICMYWICMVHLVHVGVYDKYLGYLHILGILAYTPRCAMCWHRWILVDGMEVCGYYVYTWHHWMILTCMAHICIHGDMCRCWILVTYMYICGYRVYTWSYCIYMVPVTFSGICYTCWYLCSILVVSVYIWCAGICYQV